MKVIEQPQEFVGSKEKIRISGRPEFLLLQGIGLKDEVSSALKPLLYILDKRPLNVIEVYYEVIGISRNPEAFEVLSNKINTQAIRCLTTPFDRHPGYVYGIYFKPLPCKVNGVSSLTAGYIQGLP